MSAPVLALPDFFKPFQLQTDVNNVGVGTVLLQDGQPLAFVIKAMGPRTRGLSTYEKEYFAILVSMDQWCSYLQLGEFFQTKLLGLQTQLLMHCPGILALDLNSTLSHV